MDDSLKLSWGHKLPGELLEKWPKNNEGAFVAPALLTTLSQMDMGDVVLISMLEACGIPCFRHFPHYGGFGNLILGMSAEGVDILVPETMLEDARALMEGDSENEGL